MNDALTTSVEVRSPPSQNSRGGTFRSGTAARMAGIPVSTLRIWEQRYRAVSPLAAASGHRLYSAVDIDRIGLLRALTQQGHAISSIALLDMSQLSALAHPNAVNAPEQQIRGLARGTALRIAVVGQAMAQRLQQTRLPDASARSLRVVRVFDSLESAMQASSLPGDTPIDLLLWSAAALNDHVVPDLMAAREALCAREVGVTYRFSQASARDALLKANVAVVREPSDDGALVAWLSTFRGSPFHAREAPEIQNANRDTQKADGLERKLLDALAACMTLGSLPAPRFDDVALATFAALPSHTVCECPSHVAELLMQIATFERYSAQCANRHPADARLHEDLHRFAGAARLIFEAALARVALAEGLKLPRSALSPLMP